MTSSAISVQNVSKRYRSAQALNDVSLEIAPGDVLGLLGPNGAGKSTFVKILCGLVRATEGTAYVRGHRAGTNHACAQLGYLAELFRYPPWLTPDELLSFHQGLSGSTSGRDERERLLEKVGLTDAANRRIGGFSKGMQQRLGLAQALIGDPEIVLLDEPTSALDPQGRLMVRELVGELRERGATVILNSHLLSEVELVCSTIVVMRAGKIVLSGRTEDLNTARGVSIETGSGTVTHPDAARDDVPELVRRAVARGEDVYDVSVQRSSLEDTYLAIMEGEDADA
jgi:ABC-2 type transport system ATP-binding protein